MGEKTGIQWVRNKDGQVGDTWNPLTGCTKISPGCDNCYAETQAAWLKRMNPTGRYRNGFELTLHEDLLELPKQKTKPRAYFVNSMSDLFHAKVPQAFIQRIFETMNATPQHRYMVLTKRADRVAHLADRLLWTPNIWMGVTVEHSDYVKRLDFLRRVPAAIRWVSAEPLLGPLPNLDLTEIDWLVCGGESGKGARPFQLEWARDLRDQCSGQGTAFFMKQMGKEPYDQGQRITYKDAKHGGDLEEFPEDLKVRQFPTEKATV